VLDGEFDGPGVTQSGTGVHGVIDVGLKGIIFAENGRDASLGIIGATLVDWTLADYCDRAIRGQPESKAQACGTAADNQDIVLIRDGHVGFPGKNSRVFRPAGCNRLIVLV
jgi:hypothetical protein